MRNSKNVSSRNFSVVEPQMAEYSVKTSDNTKSRHEEFSAICLYNFLTRSSVQSLEIEFFCSVFPCPNFRFRVSIFKRNIINMSEAAASGQKALDAGRYSACTTSSAKVTVQELTNYGRRFYSSLHDSIITGPDVP